MRRGLGMIAVMVDNSGARGGYALSPAKRAATLKRWRDREPDDNTFSAPEVAFLTGRSISGVATAMRTGALPVHLDARGHRRLARETVATLGVDPDYGPPGEGEPARATGSVQATDRQREVGDPPSALEVVDALATWATWVDLDTAIATAPTTPGVYMAREQASGLVVYVGMAGERLGSRGVPQGIRGRLRVYTTGKAAVSGLGEAALDRAVADPAWLRERLLEVERGRPRRALDWAQLALHRAGLQLRWASTADRAAALELEEATLKILAASGALWNRRAARRATVT